MIVVDDHFIAHRLAEGSLGHESQRVATTCSWWWRLSSALAGGRGGALSGRFASLHPSQRRALTRTVAALPQRLVILDVRELVPAMAALSADHHLNQLAAEAIVVAEVLDSGFLVRQDTPKIREIAVERGLDYQISNGEDVTS